MKHLVDTTEMYLRTIYELEEEEITPLRARIVERLEQSGPTVSQTVARMERDGLLIVKPDRSLQLTDEGRQTAIAVMRKHRLAERLLTDVLKLDINQVHDEACRWEHVMSSAVEKRVFELLDHPTTSPFGNPIPGLEFLSDDSQSVESPLSQGVRAIDLPEDQPCRVEVLQINEILQVNKPEFQRLANAGVHVGSVVTLTHHKGIVVLSHNDQQVQLDESMGHAIRVRQL